MIKLLCIEEFYIDLSKTTVIEGGAFCFSGDKEKVNNTVQWYNLDGEKLVDLSSLEQLTGTNTFAGSNLGSADTIIWPRAYKANTLGGESDSGAFRRANIRGTVYFGVADGFSLNIDRWAFGNENYFDTVILGPNVTSAANAFTDITTLKTVVLLADSIDITGSSFISNNASDVKLYYKKITTNTNFSKSEEIQYIDYKLTNLGRCGVGVVLTTTDGEVVINKFTHTEGSTSEVDATCTTPAGTAHICMYCSNIISIDASGDPLGHDHKTLVDIVYENGFGVDGYKSIKCTRCDDCDTSTKADALFVHAGYSYNTKGSLVGIATEFVINNTALKEYETFKGDGYKVNFGVFIVNPSHLTSATAFFNGKQINTSTGVVKFEMDDSDVEYARLTCFMHGFDLNDTRYTSLELAVAGYTYETGDTGVKFIQKAYEYDAKDATKTTPYVSKVTKDDTILSTITIGSVKDPALLTEDPLPEYVAP